MPLLLSIRSTTRAPSRFHCSTVVISVEDRVDRLEACTALLPLAVAELDAQQQATVEAEAAEPVAQREAEAAAVAVPDARQEPVAVGAAAEPVAQQEAVAEPVAQ
jgi:hypothetical protein